MIPALIVAALVVLVVLACLVDRAVYRWLTGRASLALSIEDSTDGDRVESGGAEPVEVGLGPTQGRPAWADERCEERPRVLTAAEELAVADFRAELVDAAQFQEPTPTLREQVTTVRAMGATLGRAFPAQEDLGHIQPPHEVRTHRCTSACPHRPAPYIGPIRLGRRGEPTS